MEHIQNGWISWREGRSTSRGGQETVPSTSLFRKTQLLSYSKRQFYCGAQGESLERVVE